MTTCVRWFHGTPPRFVLVLAAWIMIHQPALSNGDPSREPTRYARYRAGETVAYGIIEGDVVRRIEGSIFGDWQPTDETRPLAEVDLLVPCRPSKILAVGLNYRSHLGDRPAPSAPEIFFKPPSCLVSHGGEIRLPSGSNDVHYEGEMVLVIGKRARDVPPEEALTHVLGVTCGNDVSARDWQASDLQWWRAKGHDTFGPAGPIIVSNLHYDNLLLRTRVDGEVRQESRTSDLLFGVAEIVSWASRHVTLEPGDLIFTGTPGETQALRPGQVVEVELEGVGTLRNCVVGASGADRAAP